MLSDDQILRIANGESAIRVIREHRGLSLKQLATEAGLPVDRLDRLEKGRGTVRPDRLKRIADVLDVHVITLRTCQENFADCAKRLRHVGDDD